MVGDATVGVVVLVSVGDVVVLESSQAAEKTSAAARSTPHVTASGRRLSILDVTS